MPVNSNIKSLLSSIPSSIKVVAVTKTKPVELIKEAYDAGHRIFGENKVQEMAAKQPLLPDDIEWHMIGHLQSNKVKHISSFVSLIHSVDSLNLLGVINKEGMKHNRVIDVLLQMFIADEETKFGLSNDELDKLLSSPEFRVFSNIRIKGLMGIATFTEEKDKIRSELRSLVNIFKATKRTFFNNEGYFSEISMGMSNDYMIAIEEGATIVRIGSLIFGERN